MIGPVCELKHVKVEDLGVYLDSDRTQSLPLDYDFYMLTGHILNVIGKNGVNLFFSMRPICYKNGDLPLQIFPFRDW